MKNGNDRQYPVIRRSSLILVGAFIIATLVVAVPVYSVRSSSLSALNSKPVGLVGRSVIAPERTLGTTIDLGTSFPLLIPQAGTPAIATFENSCEFAKTEFNLGQSVCATATSTGGATARRRFSWVDPDGFVRQFTSISSETQNDHFTIPSDPTTTLSNGQVANNIGKWRVNIISSRGQVVTTAVFVVKDPNNATADLLVSKRAPTNSEQVAAGSNGSFDIIVQNNGPDAAATVTLTDHVPDNTTFVTMIQTSAQPNPGFTCTTVPDGLGNITCSIDSLAAGVSATFNFVYTVNAGTPAGTLITNTVSIASATTNEPYPSNNSSTGTATVSSTGGGTGTCTVSCPDDITTPANTTQNNEDGAIVHFSPPTGNAECGSIIVDHCNDCFFPVGTTVVNATADTGDSCSFTVTVTAAGAPTITCPPNKDADTAANDTSCEATVDAGTPTTTGDNVTVTGTRSDGRPLSDPYPAGTTTITWTATAHDSSGNSTGTATCQQTITVHDKTAPHITCPANKTSGTDPGSCSATVDPGTATATDNCDSTPTVSAARSDGQALSDPYPKGTTTITWTATDSSGNSSSCMQTVTVNDTEPPTITCPANITTNTEPGTCAAHVSPGTATATDNCDNNPTITARRSDNQPLTATYPKGTTTITWTATDASGNHSSCDQTVTVVDNEPPVIVLNGQTPSMWPPNHKYHTFGVTNFVTGVNDNCDTISVSAVVIVKVTSDEVENGNGDGNTLKDIVIAPDCMSVQLRSEREGNSNGRVYRIYFSVTDASGNVGTASATVVVQHNPGETAVEGLPQYTVYCGSL